MIHWDHYNNILQDSVTQFTRHYPHVVMRLVASGAEPSVLNDEIKRAAKEIVDQAIHNALAHGQPTHIIIRLQFTDLLTVEVSDDGCGFTPIPPKKLRSMGHHGVANMQERAELVGGTLKIHSEPGQGVQVMASFSGISSEEHPEYTRINLPILATNVQISRGDLVKRS